MVLNLRQHELAVAAVGDELVPLWLTERDHPWLRELCEEAAAIVGLTRREAVQRLRAVAADVRAGPRGPMAAALVATALRCETRAELAPARVRRELCRWAGHGDRAAAVAAVAGALGGTPQQVEQALLADLPAAHRVVGVGVALAPVQLALQVNLALAQGLLRRATLAELTLHGNARAVLGLCRLQGLLWEAAATEVPGVRVVLRGPLGLERHGRRYGRGLASLVPLLPWCRRFRLQAMVRVGGSTGRVVVASGDPLPAGPEPQACHSAVERDFARSFRRATAEWELVREPAPLQVGQALHFPDFELRHRQDGRAVLLEIVGFWTPGYLARKLALAAAAGSRLLLCVDERLACAATQLPPSAIPFRGRVPVAPVLAALAQR